MPKLSAITMTPNPVLAPTAAGDDAPPTHERGACGRRGRHGHLVRPSVFLSQDLLAVIPGGSPFGTSAMTIHTVRKTSTVRLTATYQGDSKTTDFTIHHPGPTLSGVAPGWVLPAIRRASSYGTNLEPGSTVVLRGPSIRFRICRPRFAPSARTARRRPSRNGERRPNHPRLRDPRGGAARPLPPAGEERGGRGVDEQPVGRRRPGPDRAGGRPADGKKFARRIYPGQTVTGTFTGNNPDGNVADFDQFFFLATAGSRISVAMERVDTSMTWENPPASIPARDRRTRRHGLREPAVVRQPPRCGSECLADERHRSPDRSLRPRGRDHPRKRRLQTHLPRRLVGAGARGVARHRARRDGPDDDAQQDDQPQAAMLDPRGWPLSGVDVTFLSQKGRTTAGRSCSSQQQDEVHDRRHRPRHGLDDRRRKVQLSPSFDSPVFSQLAAPPTEAETEVLAGSASRAGDAGAACCAPPPIPRYQAAAVRPFRITRFFENSAEIPPGPTRRLPRMALKDRVQARAATSRR